MAIAFVRSAGVFVCPWAFSPHAKAVPFKRATLCLHPAAMAEALVTFEGTALAASLVKPQAVTEPLANNARQCPKLAATATTFELGGKVATDVFVTE